MHSLVRATSRSLAALGVERVEQFKAESDNTGKFFSRGLLCPCQIPEYGGLFLNLVECSSCPEQAFETNLCPQFCGQLNVELQFVARNFLGSLRHGNK